MLSGLVSFASVLLPAHASLPTAREGGLVLKPAPEDLDLVDTIDDVTLGASQQFAFDVLFDPKNIGKKAYSVKFKFVYDNKEVGLTGFDLGGTLTASQDCIGQAFNGCNMEVLFKDPVAVARARVITFRMIGINPEKWPGDGLADVSLENQKYTDENSNEYNLMNDNEFKPSTDEFEVQEVRQVPGPLPLLGLYAAFSYSRQLRAKLRMHNSLSGKR